MTPYLRACERALHTRRARREHPIMGDVRLPCCKPLAPRDRRESADERRHRRGEDHCRALVARAAAGEPVPEDVREVMRLDGPRPIDAIVRHFPGLNDLPFPPPWEVLAHAIAPGAHRDSWLLRLDGPEGVRYGVIVELPAVKAECVTDCPNCQTKPARWPGWSGKRTAPCPSCGKPRRVLSSQEAVPAVRLRETHATLADACRLLARCGPVQAARTVRAWLRDPPLPLWELRDGLAVLVEVAGEDAVAQSIRDEGDPRLAMAWDFFLSGGERQDNRAHARPYRAMGTVSQ